MRPPDTAIAHRAVTVTLTLTAEEAWWLKSYMQNPMGNPAEEEPETAEKRGSIFSSLPDFDVLSDALKHEGDL